MDYFYQCIFYLEFEVLASKEPFVNLPGSTCRSIARKLGLLNVIGLSDTLPMVLLPRHSMEEERHVGK